MTAPDVFKVRSFYMRFSLYKDRYKAYVQIAQVERALFYFLNHRLNSH